MVYLESFVSANIVSLPYYFSNILKIDMKSLLQALKILAPNHVVFTIEILTSLVGYVVYVVVQT
jgi:hypothetical protein